MLKIGGAKFRSQLTVWGGFGAKIGVANLSAAYSNCDTAGRFGRRRRSSAIWQWREWGVWACPWQCTRTQSNCTFQWSVSPPQTPWSSNRPCSRRWTRGSTSDSDSPNSYLWRDSDGRTARHSDHKWCNVGRFRFLLRDRTNKSDPNGDHTRRPTPPNLRSCALETALNSLGPLERSTRSRKDLRQGE